MKAGAGTSRTQIPRASSAILIYYFVISIGNKNEGEMIGEEIGL